MIPTTIKSLALGLTVAISCSATVCAPTFAAKAQGLTLKPLFSEANTELYAAQFFPNRTQIVVVKKLHEADGHEAESLPEKELAAQHKRAKDQPRSSDPNITIVTLAGGAQQFVDYGWSPCVSPDGGKIYYSHQLKPISGFRVLADTQKGNKICQYEIASKTKSDLVIPTSGYLDSPCVSPAGDKLAYEICDAVNGAYGGQVGVGQYDLQGKKNEFSVPPNKHHDLFDLINPTFWLGKNLITVRRVAHSGGTYLADAYDMAILNVSDKNKVIYTAKEPIAMSTTWTVAPNADSSISVQVGANTTAISPTGAVLKKAQTAKDAADGSAKLLQHPTKAITASLTEDKLTLKNQKTGKQLSCKLPGQMNSWSWQTDKSGGADLIMIVTTEKNKKVMPVFDRDVIYKVEIPASF